MPSKVPPQVKIRKTSSHGVWAVDVLVGNRMGITNWVPFAWYPRWDKAMAASREHVNICEVCLSGAPWHWEVPRA